MEHLFKCEDCGTEFTRVEEVETFGTCPYCSCKIRNISADRLDMFLKKASPEVQAEFTAERRHRLVDSIDTSRERHLENDDRNKWGFPHTGRP